MNPPSSRDLQSELVLLTVVTLWAANFPVAKWGIGGLGVFIFNGVRYLVASAVLGILTLSRTTWVTIERTDRGKILLVSLLSSIVYQIMFIVGLSLTSAGNSAVILSTAPLWIVFISGWMHREQIRPSMWIGMLISVSGVVMIILGSGKELHFGSSGIAGDLLTLCAAFLWGLTTNLQKPLLVRYSAVQLNLIMVIFGAAGLTVFAVPDLMTTDLRTVNGGYFAAAVASGALSIGVANMLWSVGVKRLGPSKAGNFGNLVPVLAFVIAYLALGEPVRLDQGIGAGVTLTGVMIARR